MTYTQDITKIALREKIDMLVTHIIEDILDEISSVTYATTLLSHIETKIKNKDDKEIYDDWKNKLVTRLQEPYAIANKLKANVEYTSQDSLYQILRHEVCHTVYDAYLLKTRANRDHMNNEIFFHFILNR